MQNTALFFSETANDLSGYVAYELGDLVKYGNNNRNGGFSSGYKHVILLSENNVNEDIIS